VEFIVEKIGMSRTISVPSTPVTLLRVVEAKVCELGEDKTALVAYPYGKSKNKAIEGQQKKYNLSGEFNKFAKLTVANSEAGDQDVTVLKDAARVSASFNSKGRGFSGVVKRHGFAGGRGSHGHRMGRRTGSIGNCEWPGRVQPGKKMPGHYGNVKMTVQNEVVSFDAENMILVVKGSVPGANGLFGKVRIVK
jgi:large subunit ribosomal protein L3